MLSLWGSSSMLSFLRGFSLELAYLLEIAESFINFCMSDLMIK